MSETVRADTVVVPREPTPEMRIAGGIAWANADATAETYVDNADACYKAMIAASPPLRADSDEVRFDNPTVQIVYKLLCQIDENQPPDGEHWEGWVARRIVSALSQAGVGMKENDSDKM